MQVLHTAESISQLTQRTCAWKIDVIWKQNTKSVRPLMNVYSCGWIQFGGTQKIMVLHPSRHRRKNLGVKCHRSQIFDRTDKTIFAAALEQYYSAVENHCALFHGRPRWSGNYSAIPWCRIRRVRNGRAKRTHRPHRMHIDCSKVEKKAAFWAHAVSAPKIKIIIIDPRARDVWFFIGTDFDDLNTQTDSRTHIHAASGLKFDLKRACSVFEAAQILYTSRDLSLWLFHLE